MYLESFNSSCELDVNYIMIGQPCVVQGDPHTMMFNGDIHDYQGQPDLYVDGVLKNQYYYLAPCHDSSTDDMPFAILGTHYKVGTSSVSGLEYIVIELYDSDGTEYLVFLSADLHSYIATTDAISTLYDDNAGLMTDLTSNVDTSIGSLFVINYIQTSSSRIDVTLTIGNECDVSFFMYDQGYYVDGRWRMHYFYIDPPEC